MGKKVTNINRGGHVDIQTGNDKNDKNKNDKANEDHSEVTNINNGGTVGIQAGTVSGRNVVMRGW